LYTARAALKGFRQRGIAALQPHRPGPPPDHKRQQSVTDRLTALLGHERTWTSRQLAEALQPEIVLSPRQVLRYFHEEPSGYQLSLVGENPRAIKSLRSHLRDLQSTVAVVAEAGQRAIWERSL
jgi:hypothetical protein